MANPNNFLRPSILDTDATSESSTSALRNVNNNEYSERQQQRTTSRQTMYQANRIGEVSLMKIK